MSTDDIIPSNWLIVTNDKGEAILNGNNIVLQHRSNSDIVGYIENNDQNRAIFAIEQHAEYEIIEDMEQDQDIIDENEAESLKLNTNSEGWSHSAIRKLLAVYAGKKERFRNPQIKKKILWREIGKELNKNPDDCDKKFRNLKITYIKLLKKKKSSGRQVITWSYFEALDDIFGDDININPELTLNVISTLPVLSPTNSEPCLKHSIVETNCPTIDRNIPAITSSDILSDNNSHIQMLQKKGIMQDNTTQSQPEQKKKTLGNSSQKEPPKKRLKRNQDIKNVLLNIQNRQESLDKKIDLLIETCQQSNKIQEERNNILNALVDSHNSKK